MMGNVWRNYVKKVLNLRPSYYNEYKSHLKITDEEQGNYRDSTLLLGLQAYCATRKNILQLGNFVNC